MVRMFWSMPLATICETCSKLMVLGSKHKSSAPLSGYSAVAQKEAAGYSYDLLGRLALPLLCNSQKYQPPWNNRWLKINIGMSFRLYFTWHVKFAQVSQELRAIKSVGRKKKHIKTYLKKKLKETTWLMLLCRSIMFNQHPTSDAARQHPGITWPSYSGSLNLMKHRLVKTFLYWWGASTIHLSITLHIDPAIGCYSKMNDYNNDYWMLCFFFNLPAFT